jgi:ubiquinone/menaquinone biosynthesis C-methylase UbiE
MGWYDWFSHIYDSSLERLYAEARREAAAALDLGEARLVLDVPTGTGQSLGRLFERMPEGAKIVAVDLSEGMLRRAQARAELAGLAGCVEFRLGNARTLADVGRIDRLHVFLGLTTMPDYAATFDNLWSLLEPGGTAVVVDVYADKLGFQGRMVNLVARADIRRRAWEPLEAACVDFKRTELPADPRYGGTLWLASGRKPPA